MVKFPLFRGLGGNLVMPCTFVRYPFPCSEIYVFSSYFILFFRTSRETAENMKTDEKLNAAQTNEWVANVTKLEKHRLFFDELFFFPVTLIFFKKQFIRHLKIKVTKL